MTCHEAGSLLPQFFDGELDAHQMDSIASHTAGCSDCDAEIRDLRQVREILCVSITTRVDQLDLSSMWPAIDRRMREQAAQPTAWQRWREFWQAPAHGWWMRVPALATAAAVAALAFALFSRTQPTADPSAEQVAKFDYVNSIERLDTDLDSVAVFHDPDTSTTLLWVSDTAGPVTEDLQ